MSVRSKLTVSSTTGGSSVLHEMLGGVQLPEEQTEKSRKAVSNNYVLKGRCVFSSTMSDSLVRSISPMLKGEDSFTYSPEAPGGQNKTPGKRYLPSQLHAEGKDILSLMDEVEDDEQARKKRNMQPPQYHSERVESGNNLEEEDVSCPICMEDVVKTSKCIQCWQCHHYVHGTCLLRWFQSQNKHVRTAIPNGGSCPNCRSEVNWEDAVMDMRDKKRPAARVARAVSGAELKPLPAAIGSSGPHRSVESI